MPKDRNLVEISTRIEEFRRKTRYYRNRAGFSSYNHIKGKSEMVPIPTLVLV